MNTKLSGAQLVLVPINKIGENYFPLVENLRGRFIKYIDFYGCRYLPGTSNIGLNTTHNMYITIANPYGNKQLIRNLPLERLDFKQTLGVRQPIFSNLSLSDCSVNCQNSGAIGKYAAFVFWYDFPEFSAKNSKKELITDFVSIPITTNTRMNLFPDEERMTNKRFRRLLLATPDTTPDGYAGLSPNDLNNVFVTLRKGSYNIVENLPVMLLYQLEMLEKTEFSNIIFDFHSSFLTVGGAGSLDYIGQSVFFNLQYEA